MGTIMNREANLHLSWLVKTYPNKTIDELFKLTSAFRYAETIYIQSGHRIKHVIITKLPPTGAVNNVKMEAIKEVVSDNIVLLNNTNSFPIKQVLSSKEVTDLKSRYTNLTGEDLMYQGYGVYYILESIK